MTEDDVAAFNAFFRTTEGLKDTLRSGRTSTGRQESVAEHSWRLCMMAVALEDRLSGVNIGKLLRLLIIHDLAEIIHGDVPAPMQTGEKLEDERRDLGEVLSVLPSEDAARLTVYWDEYAEAKTPEARLAKGLDRLETLLQHTQGANGPDFDYSYNLTYGRNHTDQNDLVAALRRPIDDETRRLSRT